MEEGRGRVTRLKACERGKIEVYGRGEGENWEVELGRPEGVCVRVRGYFGSGQGRGGEEKSDAAALGETRQRLV